MLQIQQTYQDVKNIVSKLPNNTQINEAIQQIAIHLRASALIAGTVRFQSGVGDTSAVSQLPFPVDMGVLKDLVVRKRKSQSQSTTTAPTAAEGTSSKPATGPTAAKVAKVSLSSPTGSDQTDIDLMPNQCHCSQAFADQVTLKRHMKVVHKNEFWGCSSEWVWDDGIESHCPKVCKDKFVLWKHFWMQHQDRYLHYCPMDKCNGGRMRHQHSPNTLERYIKENQLQMWWLMRLYVQNVNSNLLSSRNWIITSWFVAPKPTICLWQVSRNFQEYWPVTDT